MIAQITAKALTKAALEAHGLKSLQSSLRTTDGGIAPSAIVHPQVPAMLPPGQQPTGPLPTPHSPILPYTASLAGRVEDSRRNREIRNLKTLN